MQIVLATDHAGFAHKEAVKAALTSGGHHVIDCGAQVYNAQDDYPDFIADAAARVSAAPTTTRAIIFGGSGQGEAMVANRFVGVRATVYYGGPADIIMLSRDHNDANVLSLGARFISETEAVAVVERWLQLPFSADERHIRRITKLHSYDHRT